MDSAQEETHVVSATMRINVENQRTKQNWGANSVKSVLLCTERLTASLSKDRKRMVVQFLLLC